MLRQNRQVYLGVDVGSVSTNVAVIDADTTEVVHKLYLRTQGQPIKTIQQGMVQLQAAGEWDIKGVGTTGSARQLAGVMLGSDVIKNEITAHAVAATHEIPSVRTILEIGGQDSKIMILQDGVVTDFAMNTVCAAGTGSFLDQQAARLNIPIAEFGDIALKSENPVRIAGRCTVFAESDMIHKQQLGHSLADILAGLCRAMVRNYINNIGKGKSIGGPVVFQGGVAANLGMRRAFSDALDLEIHVPEHFNVMGAIGAALLSREFIIRGNETKFLGFAVTDSTYTTVGLECQECSNHCEVVNILRDSEAIAVWGCRCGKFNLKREVTSHIAI